MLYFCKCEAVSYVAARITVVTYVSGTMYYHTRLCKERDVQEKLNEELILLLHVNGETRVLNLSSLHCKNDLMKKDEITDQYVQRIPSKREV